VENRFEKNVFINCPFDDEYFNLLRPLLCTILYCGYNPRIALERIDSGEVRLEKIKQLIVDSLISIHDLSKIRSVDKDEYYRLNMPFEIGLDLGCKLYHSDPKFRNKRTLILVKEPYSHQIAVSDLSGFDVACHQGKEDVLVREVRNVFSGLITLGLNSGTTIWDDYNRFYADFYLKRKSQGFKDIDINKMPISEFLSFIELWLINQP